MLTDRWNVLLYIDLSYFCSVQNGSFFMWFSRRENLKIAGVAELVDASDSKSRDM